MLTTLVICLCLATNLHAEPVDPNDITSISTSTNGESNLSSSDTAISSPPPVDMKEELAKIAASCLSSRDYERLTGNAVRHSFARVMGHAVLIEESVEVIGLRELRAALNLPPPPPWQHLNRTEPSEEELASASTMEAYFDLKEPRSKMRSLDSEHLFEHNVDTAIAYLNKRLPSIQAVFRKTFEEICPSAPEVLDKKAVDRMFNAYHGTLDSIYKATKQMLSFSKEDKCWDAVDK